MTDAQPAESPLADASREETLSALFATLVMQQANLALVMLGRVPGPDGRAIPPDIEAARMFIDQMEMLEAKTKGNLSADESKLLQQQLSAVRMAFVEAVESQLSGSQKSGGAQPAKQTETAAPSKSKEQASASAAEEESKKRFSKKYG